MTRPIIGVPMGDPAGIGPEIVVKTLACEDIYEISKPVIIGQKEVLENAIKVTGVDLAINIIDEVKEAKSEKGTMDLINIDMIDMDKFQIGKIDGQCGRAAFSYIEKSVELSLKKDFDAIATTPINKESLKAGEIPFIGHTEILEDLTDSHNPLTMFQVYGLRVFFYSRHMSLKEACESIGEEKMYEFIKRSVKALDILGVKNPKIAVAALNPHGGENGLFGREEMDEISPAIKRAKEDGIDVVGPVPADSVFHFGLKGSYDAVLSLYHDQGHIATKMVDFERTISITNNLPFLRTSVDHGTAFDIAGKGIASEVSMYEAIKLASQYAANFKK